MRCGSTGSSKGPSWPAGGCSAVTPGVTAGSTTRTTSGCFDDPRPAAREPPDPDRASAATCARLDSRDDRPAVGVVDRGAHADRPDAARAADGEADPLNAEP